MHINGHGKGGKKNNGFLPVEQPASLFKRLSSVDQSTVAIQIVIRLTGQRPILLRKIAAGKLCNELCNARPQSSADNLFG